MAPGPRPSRLEAQPAAGGQRPAGGGVGDTGVGAAGSQRSVAGEVGDTGVNTDGVVVCPMLRRHLRAVVAIERRANPHPWSHSLFAGELSMPTSRFWWIAREGRHVLGFAGLMVTLDEGHVTNFAVHEDHRRRHIATRLLLAQFAEADELGVADVTLEVRVSNEPAQALYRRFGFAPGGIRRGYYRDNGEDALVMWAHGIGTEEHRARRRSIEEGLAVPLRVEGR